MKKYLLLLLVLIMATAAHAQEERIVLSGTVLAKSTQEPLVGALVSLDDLTWSTVTDEEGAFSLLVKKGILDLSVSYLGFSQYHRKLNLLKDTSITVLLEEDDINLSTVEVMATGYQEIPKERATGSFVHIDKSLVNRRVSTSILDRLEDISSGLIFNRTGPANDPISIRGRNTLFANTSPLIIIDHFPYDGPLENINPNDVESVTILRDAAAASIWGARAGNGVIVITTKKRDNASPQFSFNTNINFYEKPDPFYEPVMSINDFIDIEQMLFDNNYYSRYENNRNHPALSPVVETLIKGRDGLLTDTQVNEAIAAYRSMDSRRELAQYFYRPQVNQQYAINLNGGAEKFSYALSAGFDRNLENTVGNTFSRYTISNRFTWKLAKDKLRIGTGIYLVRTDRNITTELPPTTFPYEPFADVTTGQHLSLTREYSSRYIQSIQNSGLLDWTYVPLDEIGASDKRTLQNDYRINIDLSYKLLPGLTLEGYYQYWNNSTTGNDIQSTQLFSTRNLINRYTQVDLDGQLTYPIPQEAIFDLQSNNAFSHSLRGQLTYTKQWGNAHSIDAIGGWELKDYQTTARSTRYYGYQEQLAISKPVDLTTRFSQYHNGTLSSIPDGASHAAYFDRFVSQYLNASYTYDHKLNLSLSARRDASNLFGVETNQKAVPLWSVGAGWTLSEEDFWNSQAFPFVKLRATYGENGNVDKSVSALTTATYFTNYATLISAGQLAGNISHPANRRLKWERIAILNLGLDVESKNSRLKGQIEVYSKKGLDLIGDSPYIPSTGFSTLRTNSASTKSAGMDIEVQSQNLIGNFQWSTNLLFSTIKEKVTDYYFESTPINYLAQRQASLYPLEDKPLFAIYSILWGGLNPDTGAPRGMLDGEPSEDYLAIFRSLSPENLQYHGPRRPTVFGAIRNSFGFKNFQLSFNISYRMGYYYRRESVLYASVLKGEGGHADYGRRWQQPGDENFTQVPSLPSSTNTLRDNIYRYSDELVEKGDHFRLQDIRLAYTLDNRRIPSLPFKRLELYTYANNLGIIWKSAKDDPLDPDFRTAKPLKSIAVGVKASF
ncbi:SusC/RagA family TonB-linked outer membrane protein [Echinicola sp. CAU 1574]|uniref:SusC/RagA family TonB-linked outer membrane protein n=1 Tax=Echinicola arenosa TaxID=2774144 RepID=A0ABR9AMX5_9BACT|nr:SusC/RagA family TonB-linked outer membrane protein [Echinicola arenosa]MBD8490156.1 SusC/RagA family TonB-linked outer membrane protein [Echinicola arenosa]